MSPTRDLWDLSERDYPFDAPLREQIRFLLGYAVLAPSSHNTQPWRFELTRDGVDLLADPRRGLEVIDPQRRQLVMSCGAALYNLRVALRRFGHRIDVMLLPDAEDPVRLARVRVIGSCRPNAADVARFAAIPKRRTNRQPFRVRPVSWQIAEELAEVVRAEGAWLTRLHPHAMSELAAIVSDADRQQFADKKFRRELSRWLVPIGSRRKDGIPFVKKEYGSALPLGVSLLVRTFDMGDRFAEKEEQLVKGSPALVVLGTAGDEPDDWLAAGQAMQAMLLAACVHGLSASFLNQALEIDDLRAAVSALAGQAGHPQLVMRLGFGPPVVRPTPRRSVDDVASDGASREQAVELVR